MTEKKARIYKLDNAEWILEIPGMGYYRAFSFAGIMLCWKSFLVWAK